MEDGRERRYVDRRREAEEEEAVDSYLKIFFGPIVALLAGYIVGKLGYLFLALFVGTV